MAKLYFWFFQGKSQRQPRQIETAEGRGKKRFDAALNVPAFFRPDRTRWGEAFQPRQRIGSAGNQRPKYQHVSRNAVQNEKRKRPEIAPPHLLHDLRAGVKQMARRTGGRLDALDSPIHLCTKPQRKPLGNLPVLFFKTLNILREIIVVRNPHSRASRNSASVRPRNLPVTTSSMPRTA